VARTVPEGSTDSPPLSDHPEAGLGPSVFRGALLEVLLLFSDYLLEGRGPSPGVSGPSAWAFQSF
jgi:hypothetical protein